MANDHINKKLHTYHSLFQINRAFMAIERHCGILQDTRFLPVAKMRVFREMIREMQSHLSHDITDKMHAIEDEDMFQFSKARIAWEHHLNPERPAFKSNGQPTHPSGRFDSYAQLPSRRHRLNP